MAQKILVVDDELETVRMVGLLLEHRGYEVIAALSGKECLEKAQAENPDLVLLDIMMPDVDGYEICRKLRTGPATADIPVIMFTARDRVTDRVAAFQAGADDFITKPVHPTELVSRVQATLVRSEQRKLERRPIKRAKVFGFLGAKGGVGTTTLTVNVAVALAQGPASDQQIILAEMRSGLAALSLQLALHRREGGLVQLLRNPASAITAEAVESQLEEHHTGVRLLTGQIKPPGVALNLTPPHAEAIVEHLAAMADYVILDLGVGLDETNKLMLRECYHVIVAVEPEYVTLELADALLDEIVSSVKLARHQVTLVMINKSASATYSSKEAIEEQLQHEMAGLITPAPELTTQSAIRRDALMVLYPDSAVAQQYASTAEYLAHL
jgi:pilus assembly protein CpaE